MSFNVSTIYTQIKPTGTPNNCFETVANLIQQDVLLVTKDGMVYKITIPNPQVFYTILPRVYCCNTVEWRHGIMSFRIDHPTGSTVVPLVWDKTKIWPQRSFDDGFKWLQAHAPHLKFDGFKKLIREEYQSRFLAWLQFDTLKKANEIANNDRRGIPNEQPS